MAELKRRSAIIGGLALGSAVAFGPTAIGIAIELIEGATKEDLARQKQERLRGAVNVLNKNTSGGWTVNERGSILRLVKDPDGKNTYTELLKQSERTGLAEYWQFNNKMMQEHIFILWNGNVTQDEAFGPLPGDEKIGTMRNIPILTGDLDHRSYIKELGRIWYDAMKVEPKAAKPGLSL